MESINLLGADDVSRAGRTIASAAEDMRRATGHMDEALQRHETFLDDWLIRFEDILKTKMKGE